MYFGVGYEMNDGLKQKLLDYGVDLQGALHRFLGMEDMYESFLQRYLEDNSIHDIEMAMSTDEYETVFKVSHALKGLAGNLGIEPIAKPSGELTELCRGKTKDEIDVTKAFGYVDELRVADAKLRELIEDRG